MKTFLRYFLFLLLPVLAAANVRAAEVIPPAPKQYVIDESGKLTAATVTQLNQQLDQFEKDTSNQIVVALYPHMQSSDDIAAYATRVYRAWGIGSAATHRGNGVLLLIFTDDHKLRIATGYGLEGALPDITAQQIIDEEITPHFKQNDFDGGVTAGVNAIMAATKGEYKGTGSTVFRGKDPDGKIAPGTIIFYLIIFGIIGLGVLKAVISPRGTVYHSGGFGSWFGWTFLNVLLNSGGSSRSGGWGGGGGFSGGGGSSGGGGASGSW